MASLPAVPEKSSPKRDKYRKLMSKGYSARQIAKKLEPDNPRKQKVIRGEVHRIAATDEAVQKRVGEISKGSAIMALPMATEALIRRASRGRVDAIKLIYEATGFHNPRVQHEHSGDIKITMDLPRPGAQESLNPGKADVDISEADVVED